MLNPINKHQHKYHILVSILTFVIIISLVLLPILSTPNLQQNPIKTPKEFTNLVNTQFAATSSSSSYSSLSISSIVTSSSLVISSIVENPKPEPKPEPKIIEEPKLEIPAQIIETQTNIEPVIIAPKPQPVVIAPKVVEVIQPAIEVAIEPKISEQPAPKPQPIPEPVVEQPKPVASDLFSVSGCDQNLANQMLALVNRHRADNNANPLSLSNQLTNIGCAHSRWMTATGTFSHTGRDGTNPFERCQKAGSYCYAENVAYNTIPNVQDLFDQFKNSPGHNINMLDPNFVEIGIAFDGIYVSQVFR